MEVQLFKSKPSMFHVLKTIPSAHPGLKWFKAQKGTDVNPCDFHWLFTVFITIFSLISWTRPKQSDAISFSPDWETEMEEGQYPHLFNNRAILIDGMFAIAVPTRGNLHAHIEQCFPHFLGWDPEHLNLRGQDLTSGQERQEKTSKPQTAPFTETLHLGGGSWPRNGHPTPEDLLMSRWGHSFQRVVMFFAHFLSENSYIYQGEQRCLPDACWRQRTLRLHPNSGRRPTESLWFTKCWVMTQIVRIWMTCSPYGSDLLFIVLKFFGAFCFLN